MNKPLAIDLFCGLGGWTEGLLAEGYFVVGFDIEQHVYGDMRYPANLVIQDVTTLHGSQFKDAALIVASPPCQEYSYMAMPWSIAKAKAAAIRADETGQAKRKLTALFDACFRIQREACEAAGHHIPMVLENVRGAIPWVGRSRWAYGSFHLWGDVPALMPSTSKATKVPGFRFDGSGKSFQTASVEGTKVTGINHIRDGHPHTKHLTNQREHVKVAGLNWEKYGHPGYKSQDFNVTAAQRFRAGLDQPKAEGRKGAGAGAGAEWFDRNLCSQSSKSDSRKAASAMIAKIPLPLSQHIARTFLPDEFRVAA